MRYSILPRCRRLALGMAMLMSLSTPALTQGSILRDLMRKSASRTEGAMLGGTAPPIAAGHWLNVQEGDPDSSSFSDGRVHMLVFIAHWSAPCVTAYKSMNAWSRRYRTKGFQVTYATQMFGRFGSETSLSRDAELDSMRRYIVKHRISGPVAITNDTTRAFVRYAVFGYPTIVLIDRNGRIRKTWMGWGDDFPTKIESAITSILNTRKEENPL